MTFREPPKAYSKGINLELYFEDLLEVVKTLCDVAKAARANPDAQISSTDIKIALDRLDALEIE